MNGELEGGVPCRVSLLAWPLPRNQMAGKSRSRWRLDSS